LKERIEGCRVPSGFVLGLRWVERERVGESESFEDTSGESEVWVE
jgi:hypothetical protein